MKAIAILLLVLGLAAAGGSGFFFYHSQNAKRIAYKYMSKPSGRFIVGILMRKSERQEKYAMGAGAIALLFFVCGGVMLKRGGKSSESVKVASAGAAPPPA